ncbi:MAG: DUF5131 family protein [Terracidiphilus sp.]
MGKKTGIEWTDSTWSPIRVRVRKDAAAIAREKGYASLVEIAEKMAGRVGQHCEHVSAGCEHCYAEANNHRCLPANGTGLPYDRRSRDLVEAFVDEKVLLAPLKWGPCHWYDQDDGEVTGDRPRLIFVENQSDIFGDWVTDEMRDRVCAVGIVSGHILQFLTKRPEEMLRYFSDPETSNRIMEEIEENLTDDFAFKWPYPNFWLGVSVENQAAADARIPILLRTPAAVRFISAEPLLSPVNLNQLGPGPWPLWGPLSGYCPRHYPRKRCKCDKQIPSIDWVICGGESGPNARPMHPFWVWSLQKQCRSAEVPFFFKQWGEWDSCFDETGGYEASTKGLMTIWETGYFTGYGVIPSDPNRGVGYIVKRVGKEAAGALLNGREWKQFPRVSG